MTFYTIHQMPETERPRERLARLGVEALSSVELIAILLGSGTKSKPVLQLAQELIGRFGSLQELADSTLSELCEIKGMGMAKAIQVKAALHLGGRALKPEAQVKPRIDTPNQAYEFVKEHMEAEKRELFVALFLDVRAQVITYEVVSIGTLSQTLVHPRELFYLAIRHKAASIIIAHNHPSGDPAPSTEDIELTQRLIEAGKMMQIPLSDHLIIGRGVFVSLREKGVKF